MKKLFILLLTSLALNAGAQNAPNAGFETWSDCYLYSDPTPIQTINNIAYSFYEVRTTLQSEVAHGGNYAAELITDGNEYTGYIGAYLSLGLDFMTGTSTPYPFSGRPDSISFWAIYDLEDGDEASFNLTLSYQLTPIGYSQGTVSGSSDSYVRFSFPIDYSNDFEPDGLEFTLTNTIFGDVASTSTIIVDDINFIYNTGTGDNFPGGDFEVWQDNSYLCPESWSLSNTYSYPVLSGSQGEPHSGNYSLRLENLYSDIFESYVGFAILGSLSAESCGNGQYTIDNTNIPTGITGYYKYAPTAISDSASVYLYYTVYDDKSGMCNDVYEMVEFLPAAENWTSFYVHVPEDVVTEWLSGSNQPGYLTIGISSAPIPLGGFINGSEGSVLLVDDLQLQFGEILSVNASQEEVLKAIYPNPASEKIRLVTGKAQIFSAEILDQSGRVLRNLTTSALSEDIDVSTLASGLYFIKVISESGIETSRFVVEH